MPYSCPTLESHDIKLDEFPGYAFDVEPIYECVPFTIVRGEPDPDEVQACEELCQVVDEDDATCSRRLEDGETETLGASEDGEDDGFQLGDDGEI